MSTRPRKDIVSFIILCSKKNFYVHYYLLNENLVSVSAIMRYPLAFIYKKLHKYEKII